jgi:type IV fimbrial biogenesis protein FimT
MGIRSYGKGTRRQTAFTVLELLVTLTIAAILLVTGVPTFQQFTWKQHMRAAVGNLHNDLLAARSAAVFRSVSMVACPGDPRTGCADSADWSRGWIVFPDLNGDRQRQPDEAVLRHGQVFEALAITGSRGRHRIRFLPDGSAPGSNGTIGFCGFGGPEQARKLVISNIGRIRRDLYPGIDPGRCAATLN